MKRCFGCRRELNRQNTNDLCYHCQRQSGHGPANTINSDRQERLVAVLVAEPDLPTCELRERFGCGRNAVDHARKIARERRGAA